MSTLRAKDGRGKPATSLDVARQAGVSQSTVSRTFRNDRRISEDTRRRVLASAKKLAYSPDGNARVRGRRATQTVGVVIADLGNPYYVHLLNEMQQGFSAMGYHVLLLIDPLDLADDLTFFTPLLDQSLDGVVITTATVNSRGPSFLAERGLPVVLAVRTVDEAPVDMVASDNVTGGEKAARHIAELGHRRIGLILGPEDTSTSRDRERGISRGLAARGLSVPATYRRTGRYSYESGYANASDLLSLEQPPTAIICGNDVVALGALEATRRLEIEVPGRVSIIGFDDIPMSGWESFRLTTVRQATPEIGRAAARLLLDRIAGHTDPSPRVEIFPMSLVTRGTTAPPPSQEGLR